MRSFSKLCKSMISSTLVMTVLCANSSLPAIVQGISAESSNIDLSLDDVSSVDAEAVINGIIDFVPEDSVKNADIVSSGTSLLDNSVILPTLSYAETAKSISLRTASMAEENGYKYYISGGNAVIDSYTGEETEVNIPETLGGLSVTEIGYAAFSGNVKITSVKIPESIKRINHDAFNGCSSLALVDIPESVISIQDGAFSGCSSLKSITIPDSISRIEDNTFSGCTKLSDINLNNIDYIGKNSFSQCISLIDFSIPETVTAIGNMAFAESGLESIEVPDTVTSLGYGIFANCENLSKAKLPKEITVLSSKNGVGMFTNCSALEKVAFPEELVEIGDYTFSGCDLLKSISIPENVNKLGAFAFSECISLEEVNIPDAVTRIENGTFSCCYALPSIKLHDSIVYLGEAAFEDCINLSSISIPENTVEIGEECFYNCDNIKEINVPESVKQLGGGAFGSCDTLEKVSLPDSIKELCCSHNSGLFTDDIALKEVKLPSSLQTIGVVSFMNCVSIEKIDLPETVTTIGDAAFENCLSLKEIDIPDGISVICSRSFKDCNSLTSAILPKNIDEVRNNAFENCISLFDLGQKAGFFKFAEYAFAGCISLNDERATVFHNATPVVNVSTATSIVGGVANFSIKYDLNDWISSGINSSENSDVRFELTLPDGLMLIESSVSTDSADNKATFVGNNTNLVSLTKSAGTLRFSARIEAYNADAYTINPRISFYSHNYSWTQRLPIISLTVPEITISAQSNVSSLNCNVYGIAEPGKKVKIYVDEKLAGDTVANEYTGKYVAEISLPEKNDSNEYTIYAVCGISKTDEIRVVYSDEKPSISKVEMIYCTHAPSNTNAYMETLDITGAFTKGERPVVQFYPAGNIRFKIRANHSERISSILIKSQKGSESKYLIAKYDEKEGFWITPEEQYFDEANHNYVPGSLNIIIFEKTKDIIDETEINEFFDNLNIEDVENEVIEIDDKSAICSLKSKAGEILTDCYCFSSDSIKINDEEIKAKDIILAPKKYGYKKLSKKKVSDGVAFSIYSKTIRYNEIKENDSAFFDKLLFEKVNEAYSNAGRNNYSLTDYVVFSQVVIADDGSVPAYINIQADAEKDREQFTEVKNNRDIIKHLHSSKELILSSYTSLSDEDEDSDDEKSVGEKAAEKANQSAIDNIKDSFMDFFVTDDDVKNVIDQVDELNDELEGLTEEDSSEEPASTGNKVADQQKKKVDNLKNSYKVWESWNKFWLKKVHGPKELLVPVLDGIDELVPDTLDKMYKHQEPLLEPLDDDWEGWDHEYGADAKVNFILDPSGIVYEGIRSKTVSGATVTCYMLNEDTGKWEKWNAEDYDQKNPLVTDEAGSYAWDVPEGRYYVTCEKEGFDLIKSEEFEVAPPKFDLDFNLLNTGSPTVKGFSLDENTITVEFNKVMDISTINGESVAVNGCNGDISVEPQLYSKDDKYTDKFVIKGDFSSSIELKLIINNKAADYTGTGINEYSADISNIYADLMLNEESIELEEERTFRITGNKEIVSFTSADSSIATVDNNGVIKAVSSGSTKITAIDKNGKEAVLIVNVKEIENINYANMICNWAVWDYQGRTIKRVESTEVSVADDKYEIKMKDKESNILDIYTIDPETAEGTNSAGEVVSLPQTGNNSMINLLFVFGAFMLIGIGLYALIASRNNRSKKEEQ